MERSTLGSDALNLLVEGDVAVGWGLRPNDIEAASAAQARGVTMVNPVDSVLHAHRKGNLAPVLEAAGIPHAADGIQVRTADELRAAVAEVGGEARITGGFSHSRVMDQGTVPLGIGGAPDPVTIRSAEQLEQFARTHIDHARTYLVQPAPNGRVMHVATAGDQVVRGHLTGNGLAPAEQDLAVRAARAFGLNAGGVDLVRDADGALRVLDVHATPMGLTRGQLDSLATSGEFREAIGRARPASTELADSVEGARTSIGVLNMGRMPGKNISRTLAEIERQGGHPVFLPAGAIAVTHDGSVMVRGVRQEIDGVLTRTGSIISDDALGVLKEIEGAGIPVMNGSRPMSLVRDKNVQARTLHAFGVAHPTTTTVSGVKDVDRALDMIGPSMVLKNPASSEGRGVMFLDGENVVRDVVGLFERRTPESNLVALPTGGASSSIHLTDRKAAERAIKVLGGATPVTDARTGQTLLHMQQPIVLMDTATGARVIVDQPVSVLSIADAFRDAKPGAVLKAETWFREAAGVDTRVHVGRIDGEHQVLAAMERRAAPNEFGEARSNLSLGGGATAITPDAQQEATAIAAAKAFDLDVAGVDLIATKNGPVVLEVNASPGLDIEKATGAVADRWISETMRRAEARS
jgi:glutathione synthase/RimK-type ligase-like ATP-grasp enzyme